MELEKQIMDNFMVSSYFLLDPYITLNNYFTIIKL